jgi:hypothetical protein
MRQSKHHINPFVRFLKRIIKEGGCQVENALKHVLKVAAVFYLTVNCHESERWIVAQLCLCPHFSSDLLSLRK